MFTEAEKVGLVVGLKETKKAIRQGAKAVYLAEDTPEIIADELKALAGDRIVTVETMKELGRLCGIDVRASCAAVRSN